MGLVDTTDKYKQAQMITAKFRSSMDPLSKEELTDQNHISQLWKLSHEERINFLSNIYEIMGFLNKPVVYKSTPSGLTQGEEHRIEGWDNEFVKKDEQGNPLDIISYHIGNIVYWEPVVEKNVKVNLLKRFNELHELNCAYIDGVRHHLDTGEMTFDRGKGGFDGYTLILKYRK